MFKKIFLVALVLCVCYLGVISARPQLPSLPVVGSAGNLGGTATGIATGVASGLGGGLGGGLVGSQLAQGLPGLGKRGGDILPSL